MQNRGHANQPLRHATPRHAVRFRVPTMRSGALRHTGSSVPAWPQQTAVGTLSCGTARVRVDAKAWAGNDSDYLCWWRTSRGNRSRGRGLRPVRRLTSTRSRSSSRFGRNAPLAMARPTTRAVCPNVKEPFSSHAGTENTSTVLYGALRVPTEPSIATGRTESNAHSASRCIGNSSTSVAPMCARQRLPFASTSKCAATEARTPWVIGPHIVL